MESPAVQKNKTECKMAIRNEEPHVNKCFPRARGDVPAALGYTPDTLVVFPAHAGMFRPIIGLLPPR